MSKRRACALFALAPLLGSSAVHAQEAPLSIRVGLLSALIVRGLQLSDPRSPVVLAGADFYYNSGWSVGAAAMTLRSVTTNRASGWVLRARRDWSPSENWTLAVGARHDGYVGDTFLQSWCYNEVNAMATYGDVWNGNLGWRPNGGPGCPLTTMHKPDMAFDLNAQWPFVAGVGIDAGAGRLFGGGSASYAYGQGGAFARGSSWTLHLSRTFTHGADPYGALARGQWVVSALWHF